jgi:hypothetical protein
MTNAKDELLSHVKGKDVTHVSIALNKGYQVEPIRIKGDITCVSSALTFIEYNSGYGRQELFGYIWYSDGTWSCRGEYDGSEWWESVERPDLDVIVGE